MSRYETGDVRVLGVDPGLAACGWGLAGRSAGGRFFYLASGVIRSDSGMAAEMRLKGIHCKVEGILREHDVDTVCIESVYFGRNKSSAMSTAGVIGVVQLAAAQAGIPVLMRTPAQIKKVTGAGGAGKGAVSLVIHRLLGIGAGVINADHESDALAAAVTGILSLSEFRRIGGGDAS